MAERMRQSHQERAKAALTAMKALGFNKKAALPVLKRLLAVHENNWEHIEDGNYILLVEAILDSTKANDDGKALPDEEEAVVDEEPQDHGLRSCRQQYEQASASNSAHGADVEAPSSKRPKLERDASPEEHANRQRELVLNAPQRSNQGKSTTSMLAQTSQQVHEAMDRPPQSTELVSPEPCRPQTRGLARSQTAAQAGSSALVTYKGMSYPESAKPQNAICMKDPKTEVGIDIAQASKNREIQHSQMRGIRKSPIAMTEVMRNKSEDLENGKDREIAIGKSGTESYLTSMQEGCWTDLEIASSSTGEVKMTIKCNTGRPNFQAPSLDAILKMVEERCLQSYKILPPDFSIGSLMNDICQCVAELGNNPVADGQLPFVDPAMNHGAHGNANTLPKDTIGSNGLSVNQVACQNGASGRVNTNLETAIVTQHPHLALCQLRPNHDVGDISRGTERLRIQVVNELGSEKMYPCSFNYIPRNLIFQNAHVNISLARIGDEDCCPDCFGDCLLAPIPCQCARETGGEFAYTPEGLVKKAFLEECISMNRFPEKHNNFYCESCPLERSKNEASPAQCRGHIIRKFIKECWTKCGCNMQCGNRVVQRGITCNLQVFLTEEKGWGLRTLEDLPKGAFICEYVGEILTNMELYKRTVERTSNAKHTYPVLLDADWGSESMLKDEEALCLDATFYGNVARFVNHRCYDANMIEIPIEIETPDRHCYHLAFFTSRKVEAFEELTWDYGIDFDDYDNPVKAFCCRCGSKGCRDVKRTRNRGKAKMTE